MSNVFTAIARLTKNAEIKHLPSGSEFLSIQLAVDSGFGNNKKSFFISASYWRKSDNLVMFLTKGTQVFISGELSQNEYTKDGVIRTALNLNADLIQLVGRPKEQNQEPVEQPNNDFNDDIPF